jgi:Cu/Ag efflux pump CusA
MMTMLVASFGLLPAALSRAIGSDSQRPFAIVIVGGLVAALILGIFLLPVLYVWVRRRAGQPAGTGHGRRVSGVGSDYAFFIESTRRYQ